MSGGLKFSRCSIGRNGGVPTAVVPETEAVARLTDTEEHALRTWLAHIEETDEAIVADVDHTMELMHEESFGPVIGIQRVSRDDAAVALMNDTEYGLTAGVYTPDESRARSILSRVKAGSVYWNCCDRVSPRLPWSGVGHSGVGLTLSTYGIQTFTRPKAWHLKRP